MCNYDHDEDKMKIRDEIDCSFRQMCDRHNNAVALRMFLYNIIDNN